MSTIIWPITENKENKNRHWNSTIFRVGPGGMVSFQPNKHELLSKYSVRASCLFLRYSWSPQRRPGRHPGGHQVEKSISQRNCRTETNECGASRWWSAMMWHMAGRLDITRKTPINYTSSHTRSIFHPRGISLPEMQMNPKTSHPGIVRVLIGHWIEGLSFFAPLVCWFSSSPCLCWVITELTYYNHEYPRRTTLSHDTVHHCNPTKRKTWITGFWLI